MRPLTTYYICNRPVFVSQTASISPNLAGRLAASFAVCYQLNRTQNPTLANRCLKDAEQVFSLANTPIPTPRQRSAPAPAPLACSPSSPLTAIPKMFGMTTWN